MRYPKVLVMGATGRTGGAGVDELLAKRSTGVGRGPFKSTPAARLGMPGGGNGWRMTTPLFAFRKEFTTRKEEIHFHAK